MGTRERFHQYLLLALFLSALWLALSGHYTGLLLALGAASVGACVWLAYRMQVRDAELHPSQLRPVATVLYLGWLSREVLVSALDVAKRVLDPALPIDPTVVRVALEQRTEVGRTLFANSITLTPGTVSIDLGDGFVRVHALTSAGARALVEGEMNRRVAALERVR